MTTRRVNDGSNIVSGPDGINVASHSREALLRARKEGDAYDRSQILVDGSVMSGDGTASPTDRFVDTISAQNIGGDKTALGDWSFKKGRPFLSVSAFKADGVDPTGLTDSTAGLRVAVAAACAANLPLYFDPGEYLVSTLDASQNILTLTRGIRVFAEPGTATIKVAPSLLAWKTLIGTFTPSTTDMSGFHVDGLVFDAQSALNPSTVVNSGQTRAMIAAANGQWMSVTRCRFKNQTGRNIIFLVGVTAANVLSDLTVAHNLFDNVGTPYWHDHSSVYLDGDRTTLAHNTFVAAPHADGAWNNAWNPYEVHGQSADVAHNKVYGYAASGLLVSSRAGDIGGKPQSLSAHHNLGYNVGSGFGLNMQQSSSDFELSDNDITIACDQWPSAAAAGGDANGPYPGLLVHSAFVLQAGALTASRFTIARNRVRWLAWTSARNGQENLLRWSRPDRAPVTDTDIRVVDNQVTNCPSSLVRVEQLSALAGWEISRNTVRNLGVAALGSSFQALVSIGRQVWQATRPTGLPDLRVNANKILDDQVAGTLSYVLRVDDPVVKVDPTVGTTNGSGVVTVTTGTVHDLGSFLAHANLPAGTYITSVSAFAAGSSFNVTAFNVSAGATATGSGAGTFTTQAPTTSTEGTELIDNYARRSDGVAVPLARLQAAMRVSIRGQQPSFVALDASGGATGGATVGSTLLDRLTGIVRTQADIPYGNNWLASRPGQAGPPVAVGEWILQEATALATVVFAEGDLILTPLWLSDGRALDGIEWEVFSAGTAAPNAMTRAVVYTSGVDGKPSVLVLDSGQVDSTTTGVKAVTTLNSGALQSPWGLYWAGVVVQGGAATRPALRYISVAGGQLPDPGGPATLAQVVASWRMVGVTGAPPASAAAATRYGGVGVRVGVRRLT